MLNIIRNFVNDRFSNRLDIVRDILSANLLAIVGPLHSKRFVTKWHATRWHFDCFAVLRGDQRYALALSTMLGVTPLCRTRQANQIAWVSTVSRDHRIVSFVS